MRAFRLSLALAAAAVAVQAQDNYEIQVYPGQVVEKGITMVELHSNFTFEGSRPVPGTDRAEDGTAPTTHALHETVEITHGFTDWFETGLYIFTSYNQYGNGYGWVGDHLRPRVAVPERLKWPVNLSLSLEFGYQRAKYSTDTWTLEIRPIIDKQVGRWYLSFNPTVDRSFHGPGVASGVVFSPNFKAGYDVTKKVNVGLEYYGSLGPITGFDQIRDQEQQIVPAIDLNLGKNWEFNAGIGIGVTQATDHLLVKLILGRRFEFGHKAGPEKP